MVSNITHRLGSAKSLRLQASPGQASVDEGEASTELPMARAAIDGPQLLDSKSGRLPASLARQVVEYCSEQSLTPWTVFQAAWAILLQRYGGHSDVMFGVSRRQGNGGEVSCAPFRVTVPEDQSVLAWLVELQDLERSCGRSVEGQVDLEDWAEVLSVERPFKTVLGVDEPEYRWEQGTSTTGRRLMEHRAAPRVVVACACTSDSASVEIHYDRRRLASLAVGRLLGHFETVLVSLMKAPLGRVGDIGILTEAEWKQLVFDWNETGRSYPSETTIHALFEQEVVRRPNAPALIFEGETWSYAELNERANQLARFLVEKGVARHQYVGVCLGRSHDLIISLLAVLKTGAAYLPIDPKTPRDRLAWQLEDAQARVLVSSTALSVTGSSEAVEVVRLDADNGLERYSKDNIELEGAATDQAYVCFTSGSTGRPKGVCVPHRAVVRLVKNTSYVSIDERDVFMHHAPVAFDASTYEIWGALLNGARLLVMSPGRLTLDQIGEAAKQYEVTTGFFTAGLFNLLVEEQLHNLKSFRQLLAGGDVLSPHHVRRAVDVLDDCVIINGYGPTENTTFTTAHRMTTAADIGRSVPIGRPIDNTTVYILDAALRPVPIGVPGELYTGGDGLATGYLHSEELTAERFFETPIPGAGRLYRTGDLARYRDDGTIEFIGRSDGQIKIRGYRVELGEIETAIRRYSGVKEAVVLAREDRPGRKQLVAYVVADPDEKLSMDSLSLHLRSILPEYMVPAEMVQMPAMPLTPIGKIDRAALPIPDGSLDVVEPRTELESKLVEIWQRVLGVEQVGLTTDFFKVGGDSLNATQLVHHIRQTFNVRVPLSLAFEASTVEELAREIESQTIEPSTPSLQIARSLGENRFDPFDLTDIQQAYLLGRTSGFELGNVSCHLYLEFSSKLSDVAGLGAAWDRVVGRHDMLRAIIGRDGRQRVLENVPKYEIDKRCLGEVDDEQYELALRQIREDLSHEVFDTGSWPLFRITAVEAEGRSLRIHVSFDLLILDGFSFLIIFDEWSRFYSNPDWEPEPLQITFRDYTLNEEAREQAGAYDAAKAYWRARLDTLPAAPELPLAVAPSAIARPRFNRVRARFPVAKWVEVKKQARLRGLTPSAVLCTLYSGVLSRWSSSPHFTLNLTLFNRTPVHPDVDRVVGDFTTLTPLEVNLTAFHAFEQQADALQRQLWRDLEHREYSGIRVLREVANQRGWGKAARMPIVFTGLLRDFSAWDWLGQLDYSITQTPQVWMDHVAMENNGDLAFHWDFVEGLFPPGMVQEMFDVYCETLERLADDTVAWSTSLFDDLPTSQLKPRQEANRTDEPQVDGLLQSEFERRAAETPHLKAVIGWEETLTYGQLDDLCNRIAHELLAEGVQPGQLVAVVMEKGWEQVAAVLAILKAGGVYVPMSASLPEQRLQYLIENACGALVVTQPHVDRRLRWPPDIRRLSVTYDALAGKPAHRPVLETSPDDLAYVIFTSGSTGVPKGVMINHRGAVNTCRDINRRFMVSSRDRVFGLSSLSFDLSVYDIFGTLATGAALVLPLEGRSRDPSHWFALLHREDVSVWNSVPALMQMLVVFAESSGRSLPPSLRVVMLSGDWIPVGLPDRLRLNCDSPLTLVSMGGATEASIWSIIYPIGTVDPGWRSIPYGKPLINQTYHVLDATLRDQPTWVAGDLYIGGVGVALGYWGNDDETARAFITHPMSGERLYRTGDLGRYLPDGNIEFLGRSDFQVKVRGHRIELGEIESSLLQHDDVREAVAVVKGDGVERSLVAYAVTNSTAQDGGAPVEPPKSDIPGATILDPLERTQFKLRQPGIRKDLSQRGFARSLGRFVNADSLFTRRRSHRTFSSEAVTFEALAALFSNLRAVTGLDAVVPKFQYASAGGLYPVQVYVQIRAGGVAGLDAGFYYYHPVENAFYDTSSDSVPHHEIHTTENRDVSQHASFVVFLVANMAGIRPLYGDYADSFAWMEAGIISHLLEERAPDVNIGLCQAGGIEFSSIAEAFRLDAEHLYLHGLFGGAVVPTAMPIEAPVASVRSEEDRSKEDVQGELIEYLRRHLPHYMVPTSVVLLDSLPVTGNGKVDRAALPSPATQAAKQRPIQPKNDRQSTVIEIFEDVLGRSIPSLEANFFDLGGNSLQLVEVHARIKQEFEQELSIIDMFSVPTVNGLAGLLSDGFDEIKKDSTHQGRKRQQLRGYTRRSRKS